ncbi:MAG: helix-turn-helix domain-containing protein [Candidatus Helarchaeota archaeon]
MIFTRLSEVFGIPYENIARFFEFSPQRLKNMELNMEDKEIIEFIPRNKLLRFIGIFLDVEESIGKRLLQWRLEKGFSRSDVAEMLNVSVVSIWKWEIGEGKPNPENYRKIAELISSS